MGNQYLVSICIPTYNRAEYLKASLESLLCQPEVENKKIEIVVSDNISSDSTQELCLKYAKQYDNFHYYRNSQNIGSAKNSKHALELGNGKLLKLCGDDYLYSSDAAKIIYEAAERYQELKPQLYFSNCSYREKKTLLYKEVNIEKYLYEASFYTTWFLTFSIWRDDFYEFYNDNNGMDVLGVQVEYALRVLEKKNEGIIVNAKLADRPEIDGKNLNYDLMQPFYYGYLGLIKPFVERNVISKECYNWCEKDVLLNFYPVWMAAQELKSGSANYYTQRSLKKDVLEICKYKPYRNKVFFRYKKAKIKIRIHYLLKEIFPFFIHR